MRLALDQLGEERRPTVYDVVAGIAGEVPLVTIAASNDDLSLAALATMLSSLKHATRGQVKLLVDRPLTHFLPVQQTNRPSTQAIAAAWAVANDVDAESCADTVANDAVLTDPWAVDPGASIRRWHYVARNVAEAVKRDSLATHVAVFDTWTACRRGVDRSLVHVEENQFPRVTIHMGCNVPVSQQKGPAPFDWMVPLRK